MDIFLDKCVDGMLWLVRDGTVRPGLDVCVCVGGGFVTKASRVADRQAEQVSFREGGRGGYKLCTVYPLLLLASSCNKRNWLLVGGKEARCVL